MRAGDLWGILKETVNEFSNDKASRMGAALAYYSLFSVGPLLMLVIAIAGLVFGEQAVSGELFNQLQGLIGAQGAGTLQTLVASVSAPKTGIIATVVGGVTLIIGASGVITALKDSLNSIWQLQPKPGRGIRYFVMTYIISLAAIIGIGFLLMVSLVLSAALAAAGRYFSEWLPLPEWSLHGVSFLASFLVLTLLFGFMYKFLPDIRIRWRDVLLGGALTSLLFSIGKLAIGLYLGKQTVSSTYGAAGSIVVLLIWIYFSSQIFLLGAEFTEVYTRWTGDEPELTQDVQKVDAEALIKRRTRKAAPRNLAPQPG